MNKKTILPLALIGTAVYFLATKTLNASQLFGKLTVVGGKIKKFSLKGLFSIDVQIELQVQNTGSISIPLEYYTGTITHAGTQVSNFTFNGTGKNVVIKERSTTPMLFNLQINTLSFVLKLVNVIKDVAAGRKVDSKLFIDSSFYAGGFDLPVKFEYDLKPDTLKGIGKLNFRKVLKFTPVGAGLNLIGHKKRKIKAAAAAALKTKNCTPAVAGVKATLEFKTNSDMEDYFGGRKPLSKIIYSKN